MNMRTITVIICGWILKKSILISGLSNDENINNSTLSPDAISKNCPIRSNEKESTSRSMHTLCIKKALPLPPWRVTS